MGKDLNSELIKSTQFADWVCDLIRSEDYTTTGERNAATLILFNLSLDHYYGVISLTDSGNGSSAFALVRPQVEAFLKGAWIYFVASDREVSELLKKGEVTKSLQELANEIQPFIYPKGENFSDLIKLSKSGLHSMTHGGLSQLSRHFRDGKTVKSEFLPEEMNANLQFCTIFFALTGYLSFILFEENEKAESVLWKLYELELLYAV